MAASGITTCGEFHYFHHNRSHHSDAAENYAFDEAVVQAARDANVRLVLLEAVYERSGFGSDAAPLSPGQERFRTADLDRYWSQIDRLSGLLDSSRGEAVGVVAHSMRAVSLPTLKALGEEARRREMVLHVHVEEQPQEIEDCLAEHGATPLALLM